MKCLEMEKLIGYVYHRTDDAAASQVRAHLEVCPRCRETVEQFERLGAVLNEWKAAEPTPGFDARVRQALEVEQTRREGWAFWGFGWARGMAVASLGVLLIVGTVWFTRAHHRDINLAVAGTRHGHQAIRPPTPDQAAKLPSSASTGHAGLSPEQAVPEIRSSSASSNDDNDVQALEDYDLAANFDLLSELPKGEPRVAN